MRCKLAWTQLTEFWDLAVTNFQRVSSEQNFFYSELRSKRIQKDYQKDFCAHWIGNGFVLVGLEFYSEKWSNFCASKKKLCQYHLISRNRNFVRLRIVLAKILTKISNFAHVLLMFYISTSTQKKFGKTLANWKWIRYQFTLFDAKFNAYFEFKVRIWGKAWAENIW